MIKETEIKLKIPPKGVKKTRRLLYRLGGHPSKPYRQTTLGFFSRTSIKDGVFPRIRDENGKWILTVKVRPKKKTKFFERKEYSAEVKNVKEGIGLLMAFGFTEVKKFSKVREEWRLPKVKVALDKLYFGNFLEIEGEKQEIKNLSVLLGYEEKDWIAMAYLGLEENYQKAKTAHR